MEVHHHSHTSRKKWTHYFWEFIMLFLAVFCGFLAEYQLEHKIESDREKVLAKAFYEDIKKDTAALINGIAFSKVKIEAAEKANAILRSHRSKWNDTLLYKDLTTMTTVYPFIATNGTYEQMKASGSLRYFSQLLVNQMNAYYVQVSKTEHRDVLEGEHLRDRFIVFLIDNFNLEAMSDIRLNEPITHEIYFNQTERGAINKIVNLVAICKIVRTRSMMEYEAQLKIADSLLGALENKYRLK
jgi:hypothetical protein